MPNVIAIMSMSLDGYVADLADGVEEVFDWYFGSGDVEIPTGGSDPMTFRCPSRARSTSEVSRPTSVPCSPVDAPWTPRRAGVGTTVGPSVRRDPRRPRRVAATELDGALRHRRHRERRGQAGAAAGEKSVGVHGADTISSASWGLLDEIHVDLAAVLLGSGIRLFDHLSHAPPLSVPRRWSRAWGSPTCATPAWKQ